MSLGITLDPLLRIIYLLWVDDVVSFAEGEDQQHQTLRTVHDFAVRHKLKWGIDKCKVMEIGNNAYTEKKWPLGNEEIVTCDHYRYLGDVITRNGDNTKNLEEREARTNACTRRVRMLAGSEVISLIEVTAMLKLHEAITVPMLLTNCETWILSAKDSNKINRIEVKAFKELLGVPVTTPTAGILMVTGALQTSLRIHRRQLLYLQTLLKRDEGDWCKKMLLLLENNNAGWTKQINKMMKEYEIQSTWDDIKSMSTGEWKRRVDKSIEKKNKNVIIDMCGGTSGTKTKTKKLLPLLEAESYKRQPMTEITGKRRRMAKALTMGLCGMLDCANNYAHKYGTKMCNLCNQVDDESHRINYCEKWRNTNLCGSPLKINFSKIVSRDPETLERLGYVIEKIWDLENGKNTMRHKFN